MVWVGVFGNCNIEHARQENVTSKGEVRGLIIGLDSGFWTVVKEFLDSSSHSERLSRL